MKTLLIGINSKFIHINLAIRYLKNNIDSNISNLSVKEFTINQKIDYIISQILKEEANIVAFSCYIWNIEYIKKLIYILKTANPEITIILGGPEVSYDMENFMLENPSVDFIIFGEGEITFNELIRYLNNKNYEIEKLKGVAWKNNDNIYINEKIELIKDIDTIKSPYREKEDFKNKILYYETSRGCPYRCSFCMSSIEKKVRYLSIDKVKKDLRLLLNTNAKQIKFVDRTFNSDYKRSMEIMKFIEDNNKNNINIHLEITADIINNEFLDYLEGLPVNMYQFEIGIQSFNYCTLEEINRYTDIDKLKFVIRKIKSFNNIHQHVDLIAGLPYESYEIFKESFNEVHNLNADKIQLGFLKVLKGTQVYNDRNKHKIKYLYYAPYEVIKTKYISYEEINKLKKVEELVEKYYNEGYFQNSLNYIISNLFKKPFDFYEKFSDYWEENNLFDIMHKRKKLYIILYNFIKKENGAEKIFNEKLKYDYIFNNPQEELLNIFDKSTEERHKKLKHDIFKVKKFKERYFYCLNDNIKYAINYFRIVDIGKETYLFVYKDKNNIFDRCEAYSISNDIKELKYDK